MYFPMTASLWRRLVKDAGHDAKKLCIVACALCTELEYREAICRARRCSVPYLIDVRILG